MYSGIGSHCNSKNAISSMTCAWGIDRHILEINRNVDTKGHVRIMTSN